MNTWTRRRALRGLFWSTVNGALTGGCWPFDPDTPLDPTDPALVDPKTPLTIDVHSHVFNGSDLQIERFFSDVYVLTQPELKPVALLLQGLGDFAPSGHAELQMLDRVAHTLDRGDHQGEAMLVHQVRQERYQAARKQVAETYARLRATRALALEVGPQRVYADRLQSEIDALPETYEAYRDTRRTRPLGARNVGDKIGGALDFVLRNFQYRYVNVHDYLEEYSIGPTRRIDLVVAHLVDCDWPLGMKETHTPMSVQVDVMERISHMTRGWVHGFVPFCPFKWAAFNRGLIKDDPLALAQKAVRTQGHIGVKIYPPMGFRPFGNTALDPGFWDDSFPLNSMRPSLVPDRMLGATLDVALSKLYAWCIEEDVPIMAHTSPSNFPVLKYQRDIMDPQWWRPAIYGFPGLRLNFGHFGNTDIVSQGITNATSLMGLMNSETSGQKVYADSAYFEEILTEEGQVEAQLRALFTLSKDKGEWLRS
jgi:hypothetical protein